MPLKSLIVAAALAGLAAVPAAASEKPNEARDAMRALGIEPPGGKKLRKRIAEAEKHPLGSAKNPVRANMPEGQRAYLERLRCPGGDKPAAERKGSLGPGVYGSIVDLYTVTCPGAKPVDVHMDMYHDSTEERPLPGFTAAPAQPAPGT